MVTETTIDYNHRPILCVKEINPQTEKTPLTDIENSTLEEFKLKLPEITNPDKTDHDDEAFCDEACLLIYLRATRWKLQDAIKRLKSTLDWRRSYKPHKLEASQFLEAGDKGHMYFNGFDLENRPIFYMRTGNQNHKDEHLKVQLMVFTLETAIKCLPPGVEKLCIIVDWRDASINNGFSLSAGKEATIILSQHYPERMGKVFSIDASWILTGLLKCILPLLDPVTREKISIINLKDLDNPDKPEKMSNYIDLKYLPKEYGGQSEWEFNGQIYFEEIQKLSE